MSKRCFAPITLLLALAGCGGSDFPLAPVSGRVTLDGAPLSGAKVLLLPQASGKDGLAGPTSNGLTDENGRFTVKTVSRSPEPGAVVGTHRVTISTLKTEPDPSDPLGKDVVQSPERVPPPYNTPRQTPLRLEVPPEGTDQANFDLQTGSVRR